MNYPIQIQQILYGSTDTGDMDEEEDQYNGNPYTKLYHSDCIESSQELIELVQKLEKLSDDDDDPDQMLSLL